MRFYCTASSGSSVLKFLPGMEGLGGTPWKGTWGGNTDLEAEVMSEGR